MKLSPPLALVVAALAALAPVSADEERMPLPNADDFTKLVLEVARSYPTDGKHAYYWPKTGGWEGTTRDLFYMGEKVASGDPEGRCYCCGLTFEVFFRAYEKACERAKKPFRILDLDAKGITRLRREWYGPTEKDRLTVLTAVTKFKLGRRIPLAEARAGDFCQLWRRSGSGHSVILLEVEKDAAGKPTALRYWSTQGSTKGISERTERFSEEKSGVIEAETYVARVGAFDDPEAKPPEAKSPEAKSPEAKSPEAKAPEAKAPEAKAPEAKAPEAKAPGAEGAGTPPR